MTVISLLWLIKVADDSDVDSEQKCMPSVLLKSTAIFLSRPIETTTFKLHQSYNLALDLTLINSHTDWNVQWEITWRYKYFSSAWCYSHTPFSPLWWFKLIFTFWSNSAMVNNWRKVYFKQGSQFKWHPPPPPHPLKTLQISMVWLL